MTADEITALQSSGLPRDTPYAIEGVSQSQFSIARHYGGMTYQGEYYAYNFVTDTLVRADVLAWLAKRERTQKAKQRKAEKSAQGELLAIHGEQEARGCS